MNTTLFSQVASKSPLSLRAVACMFLAAVSLAAFAPAQAALLEFQLANTPDGALSVSNYGLRLDGLFGTQVSGGPQTSHWVFDFEHPESSVNGTLDTVTNVFQIFGQAFGGLQQGNGFVDGTSGVYDIDFIYLVGGESQVSGSQVVYQVGTANSTNNGLITPAFSSTVGEINIVAGESVAIEQFMQFFFDGSEAGGYLGEGWLNYTALQGEHISGVDWKFTASLTAIPLPPVAWLFFTGAVPLLLRIRRR